MPQVAGATRADRIGEGKRVLVVNDTEEILELFEELLRAMGFDVLVMSYAPRELQRVRDAKPDIVILDFIFGQRELLGWQLLQKMKMDRDLDEIPVIVCTAAQQEVYEQQGYLTEQGVTVILKPFNNDQLEDAVARALALHDSSLGLRRRRADEHE
jgi:CheY-like chemotaxis protein